MMSSRIMETMLSFVIDTLKGEFEDMRMYMLHEIETGKGQWYRTVNQYKDTLGITWEELKLMEKKDLKKIRDYDTEMWKKGMMNKETTKMVQNRQGEYRL